MRLTATNRTGTTANLMINENGRGRRQKVKSEAVVRCIRQALPNVRV